MKKSITILGIIGLSFLSALFLFGVISVLDSGATIASEGIRYDGYVCTQVTRADGTVEDVECQHNVLYLTGKNMTRDLLSNPSASGDINIIALCNASTANAGGCGTPVEAATQDFREFPALCGMTNTTGTYSAIAAQQANYTLYTTFTSTCDNVITNATRLKNETGSAFAAVAFTTATLQTNDQLTINWTISIS